MSLKLVIVITAFSLLETIHCLKCRACFYAVDVTRCGASTVCKDGEHCGIHAFSDGGNKRYHAGCISTEVCEGKQVAPINIFGRRRRRQATTISVECCDTDLCNTGLSNAMTALPTSTSVAVNYTYAVSIMTTPQTTNEPICLDHDDCPVLLQRFPICNDTNTAFNICPKTCGKCGISTTLTPLTQSSCMDESKDCKILIAHFRVCRDLEYATVKCRESCNLCTQPTILSTASNVETPMTSTTQNRETPMTSVTMNIETPFATPVQIIETPPTSPISERETPPTPEISNRETPPTSALSNKETPPTSVISNRETPPTPIHSNRETPPTSVISNRETPPPNRETPTPL